MARSRPFGLFILVLCLVVCVCAHGQVSKADAEKILKETKAAAKKTLRDAKERFRNAESYLNDANANKRSAERAAAEAAEAAKGNQAAEAIAQKVKNALDEALKLHTEVSVSAKDKIDKMKLLVTKATTLDTKATAIQIETETSDGYTKAKQSAEAVKTEVDALDNEIKTASGLTLSYEKLNKMSEFVKTAELAKYHVDAIVAVAKIDTLLESADNDIKLIEQKRDEINVTVQEVKILYDNSPEDLIHYIHALYSRTETEFESASKRAEEAKKVKAHMLEQKAQANEALVKVKDETDVEEAKDEVAGVNQIAKNAEKNVEEIKKALQSATVSAANAVHRKNAAVNELNRKKQIPVVTQDNKKTNPPDPANTHQPVEDTTESSTVSGTMQPTITKPDQTGSGGTKNTHPFSNDSAMTVSVPLLLALIVCAALH